MFKDFSGFHLREELRRALDEAGYDTPTPIQEQAIPILLEGRDLIGIAETGTGKTLAFLLSIFQRLDETGPDPKALIVCPTRELAMQVAGESDRFGRHMGVRTVLAYGGTSSGEQKQKLAAGCDVVVGTPGRLLDFVTSAWLSLRKLRFLVLDEADRMLDMGFINDVDAILRKTPMSRQTILFSATIPDGVRDLAARYMFEPETVEMHTGTKVTPNVEHVFYPVRQEQKERLLAELLERENADKTLIFTATRERTSELALALRKRRHEVLSLSSLLSQENRQRALAIFRRGECSVLVATDVAARGLDVVDIDLVVNYDLPMLPEDYVHRIGRTGRAERSGRALTLVSELDTRRAADIERLLREKIPRLELEGFPYKRPLPGEPGTGERRGRGRGARGGRRPSGRGRSGRGGAAGGGKRRRSGSGSE
jgi:ATP-dependent RNA helicase RhlE